MAKERTTTKILFIDNDEQSFEFRKCMAKVLAGIPPVELFHANDATEALSMLEEFSPDVVVVDDDIEDEQELFMDSLPVNHPPIIMQMTEGKSSAKMAIKENVLLLIKKETLEGIHETLTMASQVANRTPKSSDSAVKH